MGKVIVALSHKHTIMLVLHIQLVKAVHPEASATPEQAVDSVLINFLMVLLAAAACNVNLKCALNMIINKTFATHALVITLRPRTPSAWKELPTATQITNIAQTL